MTLCVHVTEERGPPGHDSSTSDERASLGRWLWAREPNGWFCRREYHVFPLPFSIAAIYTTHRRARRPGAAAGGLCRGTWWCTVDGDDGAGDGAPPRCLLPGNLKSAAGAYCFSTVCPAWKHFGCPCASTTPLPFVW